MKINNALLTSALLATIPFTTMAAWAAPEIEATTLDNILADKPLQPGGPPAAVIANLRAGNSELQVLVMDKIRLHHHDKEDHVVYIARGHGTARLENANGDLESRPVAPGDILSLPRGLKHAFDTAGDENLVLLVVATAGWKPLEDTEFHE